MSQLSDADVQAKWREMAPLIDRMMERVGTEGEFPVAARSSLAGDDRASNPYQVSHILHMCLMAGVDHLHAVKVLVIDQGVLHVAAPSSLARGALENFSAAYWILGPAQRTERVSRALRWHAKNFKDSDTATSPLGPHMHSPLDPKMQKLYAVGAARGISNRTIRAGYASTEAVRYAEAEAPNLGLGVVLPWRLCSGFAHGRPWAYLGSLDLEKTPGPSSDITHVRMTSDLTRALFPNLAALHLLERFLHLYQQRSASHLI